jgi:hypothetical protein
MSISQSFVHSNTRTFTGKLNKGYSYKLLKLELRGGPFVVFSLEVAFDPLDRDGSPNTSPEEGYYPADLC